MIPLSIAHAELIAGMHHICFAEPWDVKAMGELLAMPDAFGFLVSTGDKPQGFILCRAAGGEAEVLTILVLPPYRRSGLAAQLLDAAYERARQAGAEQMFLEVAANNDGGIGLYQAQGFTQVGRRKNYYGGATDALVMMRPLPGL